MCTNTKRIEFQTHLGGQHTPTATNVKKKLHKNTFAKWPDNHFDNGYIRVRLNCMNVTVLKHSNRSTIWLVKRFEAFIFHFSKLFAIVFTFLFGRIVNKTIVDLFIIMPLMIEMYRKRTSLRYRKKTI